MEENLLTKFNDKKKGKNVGDKKFDKMKKRGNAISYSLTKGEKGREAMIKPHDRNKKNKEQEQN